MLRLLLCLASVSMVAGVLKTKENITSCPVNWYGINYQTVYILQDTSTSMCFTNYSDTGSTECVLLQNVQGSFSFSVAKNTSNDWHLVETRLKDAEANVSSKIPKETPTCALYFDFDDGAYVFLVPYGQVLLLLTESLNATASNSNVIGFANSPSFMVSMSTPTLTVWVEGCRQAGAAPTSIFAAAVALAATCEHKYCTVSGEVTETVCAPTQACRNGTCAEWSRLSCAVVPGAVIDSGGKARFLENFCPQPLLYNDHIQLSGTFLNRRLTDVPFLEILTFDSSNGSVWYLDIVSDGSFASPGQPPIPVPDNGTSTRDFLITHVPGGLLVSRTSSDFILEVFYDGTTAHIHYEGFAGTVTGPDMCSNNSVAKYIGGLPSCDEMVSDPRGDNIDCETATQRCNALLRDPFNACSVDPQPFISACTNLLCNYTDTDGVYCHLLEAYARTCDLQDWMDSVGCSASECFNNHCLFGTEFCGLSLGGEPRCFCRASYAAPYRADGTLGKASVCVSKRASISLVGCLLEELGVNISSLHLNDPSCTGVQDPRTHMVTFSFSDADHCAANVSVNNSRIIYSNTIQTSGDNGGIISREDQLSIQFSCAYAQPEVQTMSLKIKDSSVVKVIDAGEWTYVFNMTAFTDYTLRSAVGPGTEVRLDQPLWVQAKATEVDDQLMALVIEGCWATKENDANSAQKYSLIKNGCSDEQSVDIVSNGESLASVFSFRVFQFVGSDADVYLHCDTKLCLKSTGCSPECV